MSDAERTSWHPDLALRWGLSLISGLGLAALTLLGFWFAAHVLRPAPWRRLSDDDLAIGFAVAAAVWAVLLSRIWAGVGAGRRTRGVVRAACWTLVCVLTAVVGGVLIDSAVRRDEELLVGAWALGLAATTVSLWIPVLREHAAGRPVVNTEHLVDVRCPRCGYSLIGLRELRCPECGEQFTIDALIRAQNYDGARRLALRAADEPPGEAPPPVIRLSEPPP